VKGRGASVKAPSISELPDPPQGSQKNKRKRSDPTVKQPLSYRPIERKKKTRERGTVP